MEVAREYLSSHYFSSHGYIVIMLHYPSLVIFSGYTGSQRASERRTFSCPSSPDSRGDCWVKYDQQYNSPFPLYGFVLLCFLPPLVVCMVYSWCFARSRVDEIEIALKSDPENPRRRPRRRTRRVFFSYFLHLLVRLVLGILFVVLQNFVLYPNGFPVDFFCAFSTVKPTVNSTSMGIDCVSLAGQGKARCAMGIWIVNTLLTIAVFVELSYLSVQAIRSKGFTFDPKFCQKHLFNKREAPDVRESRLRREILLIAETEFLEPLVSQPKNENNRLLDDIFVDLVIYTGRAKHEFTDLLTRREIFDIYLKPQSGSIPLKKSEDLFLPNEDTPGQDPRKILVVGSPGIGKSLLCTRLARDWSMGDLLADSHKSFEHLFLFQLRWFNTETPEKISLKQLLSRLCLEGSIANEILQDVLDNPEKVLLIFDGLDEFKYHQNCLKDDQAHFGNSPTEEIPFPALYVKLVEGKQLSGATILTTCRPDVVQSLAGLHFDRRVEIMGFTPEKVQEYVYKFFAQDPETGNKIWGYISSNAELLSLCYIPVNSFIVCSILEELIKLQDKDSGSALPTTSTEIYNAALRFFIFKVHPEFKGKVLTEDYLAGNVAFPDSVEETLSRVESLAEIGIEQSRSVFDSAEVKGMEDCGLFHRMPNFKTTLLEPRPDQFCFIHLTLQQLLAARKIAKRKPSDLSDFITSNISDPKWHLVIQFVAGLLGRQKNVAVNTFISLLCDSLTEKPPIKSETKLKALLMMKCLHECNDETTLEKAAYELQKNSEFRNKINLANCQVTAADCTAVMHFLSHMNEIAELDISCSNIPDQGILLLRGALVDASCKLTQLDLSHNNMTDQGVAHLCVALKYANCNLRVLNLSSNNLTDVGVALLCDALKDVNCKLAELDLSDNFLTDEGVVCLCDALQHVNSKLTVLNISSTDVTDKGVALLCCALRDVNCVLTELDLSDTYITDQGVSQLCYVLKSINCKLTYLDLKG